MKKLLLLAMITAMVATTAVAQESKAESPIRKNNAEWEKKAEFEKKLKVDLNLTPEQSAKYDVISADFQTRLETLKKDANLDKDGLKEKKMGLKKEKEAKILEILTPDQQTKYKEIMEKAKQDMKKPS